MTTEDKQFIDDNIINFESVKLGFTRNIDMGVLDRYEAIYRKYLDPHFVLTKWCGACVFDMIQRLMWYYESLPKDEPVAMVADVKRGRGRPKKL